MRYAYDTEFHHLLSRKRPRTAYAGVLTNITGIALFLAGILRWLTGEKKCTRNWDDDTTFTSSSIDGGD